MTNQEQDQTRMNKSAFDVFISHSSKDKQIADAVKHGLHSAGIRCWMAPDDITPGRDWAAEVADAIEECPVMVLIWTQASVGSLEVSKELTLAMSTSTVVIPFRLEDIQPEGSFKYHLTGRHWPDVYNKELDQAIDELIRQARVNLGYKEDSSSFLGSATHTVNIQTDKHTQSRDTVDSIGLSPHDATIERPTGLATFSRIRFWQQFSDFAKSSDASLKLQKPHDKHWFHVYIGRADCKIALTLLTSKNRIGCELHIPDSKELFHTLYACRAEIGSCLDVGAPISWQELPEKKGSRIQALRDFNVSTPDHDEAFKWLLDSALKFKSAFTCPRPNAFSQE